MFHCKRWLVVSSSALLSLALACAGPEPATGHAEQPFSSAEATLLELTFEGELFTSSSWNPAREIEAQLLYSVGQLNGDRSVGRLDRLELSDVTTSYAGNGLYRVGYRARLPVGWGAKTSLPTSYELVLPRRTDYAGQLAFVASHGSSCVSWDAHDVDAGSMWYYYRPRAYGCQLTDDEVVRLVASATVSDENTTGKYPEYDRIWADARLEVVAIFGKNEVGATSSHDAGIAAYNEFVAMMKQELPGATTVPVTVPSSPGVAVPDVTFSAELPDGRTVRVVALLIDGIREVDADFEARYESLTPTADTVMYFGHSGLGANIRALARMGEFVAGQYQIFFLNGCDTFAYVDAALTDAHRAVNPDDLHGTRYLDLMTNIMPAYFSSNADNGRALVRALMALEAPLTYEQMFDEIDRAQVVVVTGEEDNTFSPGGTSWEGFSITTSVAHDGEYRLETPVLEPGAYRFSIAHDPSHPGGDADLYVRAGASPTRTAYDCRPYRWGSAEVCTVTLDESTAVHLMVHGYAAGPSYFVLEGAAL